MDIVKIQQMLDAVVEQFDPRTTKTETMIPVIQCYMLLHIYEKLESIDDTLITMNKEDWQRHNP